MSKTEVSLRQLLIEQQIINPSYTHYGGLAGFQDYGIVGCRIKKEFLEVWREHFLTENIDEVEVPDIVPYPVLKASGHVDKFTDPIVEIDGNEIRADHLVKEIYKAERLEETLVDAMTHQELEQVINKHRSLLLGPEGLLITGGYVPSTYQPKKAEVVEVIKVRTKSLMLGLNDGSTYLMRPEIAQTIYPNFRRYYDYHKGRLPFGIAQTGRSYRNEICPKPFERLRSFHQAEIEYFYDPVEPSHRDWLAVSTLQVPLFSSGDQLGVVRGTMRTLKDALDTNIIKDQITATYIGKIYLFAKAIGLKTFRFRQHLSTEMAHYAVDCWDLECFVDNHVEERAGRWLECIGIANRNDYDLRVHDRNQAFLVKRDQTVLKKRWEVNTKHLNITFKKKAKEMLPLLNTFLENNENIVLPIKVLDVELGSEFVCEKEYEEAVTFYPCVIEPSFGIDRLIYAMLEQNYWIRPKDNNDEVEETRQVLSLKGELAPYNVAVLQLSNKDELLQLTYSIAHSLKVAGFSVFTDPSGTSIGKRYVRTDRIGIPKVVTVDFDSLVDNSVTIRNRDDMKQVRVPILDLTYAL